MRKLIVRIFCCVIAIGILPALMLITGYGWLWLIANDPLIGCVGMVPVLLFLILLGRAIFVTTKRVRKDGGELFNRMVELSSKAAQQ